MDVPLIILDREVARAAGDAARARARLARGEDLEAPSPLAVQRHVSSRATWLELAESKDPLAAPLRTWVGALTLERVLWPDLARLAGAWRATSIPVEVSGIVPYLASPHDLLVRVLAEPQPARRRVLADVLARGAVPVADAARMLAERRAEAMRLLGPGADAAAIPIEAERVAPEKREPEKQGEGSDRANGAGRMELARPASDGAGAITSDPRAALRSIAERVLAETLAFMPAEAGAWGDAIALAIGRSSGEGWPARLNVRWLFDLFQRTSLVDGLRLEVGSLPQALGAASFARALAAFGGALADVDGPRSGPFVMARAPFDLRRARRAALFGSLAADPVFGARALGLGRGRARDQARDVARALLVSLRLDAARVLLGDVLLLPGRQGETRFEEITFAALSAPIPPALAGVVPRLGPDDPSRLVGALLSMSDRRSLIERFDEDWFASPHAALAIREEDAVPASPTVTVAAVSAGVGELVRALHDLG
ncbi:Chromosome partition protein smc [Minicystis rosea]|nr:Chromosome partition protein smc [Minicystis rosea]